MLKSEKTDPEAESRSWYGPVPNNNHFFIGQRFIFHIIFLKLANFLRHPVRSQTPVVLYVCLLVFVGGDWYWRWCMLLMQGIRGSVEWCPCSAAAEAVSRQTHSTRYSRKTSWQPDYWWLRQNSVVYVPVIMCVCVCVCVDWSPVSIQTQSLALRALRKRKPQETQALAYFHAINASASQ